MKGVGYRRSVRHKTARGRKVCVVLLTRLTCTYISWYLTGSSTRLEKCVYIYSWMVFKIGPTKNSWAYYQGVKRRFEWKTFTWVLRHPRSTSDTTVMSDRAKKQCTDSVNAHCNTHHIHAAVFPSTDVFLPSSDADENLPGNTYLVTLQTRAFG